MNNLPYHNMRIDSTLVDVLKNAAQAQTGITFIRSSNDELTYSYQELLSKALYTLQNLQDFGVQSGDEVIIQVNDNADFLQVFWACILGKIIPVPVAIGRQEGHKYKLYNIWKKLNNPFLVWDQGLLEKMISYKSDEITETAYQKIAKTTLFTTDAVLEKSHGTINDTIQSEDIAYIQFSSGSTGNPKGVVLTHANLVANIVDIANRSEITQTDRSLSWLPLTHDMGLICFHLSCTLRKIEQFLLPTTLFIRRPLLWMDKASEHKASLLYSPNFGCQYILSAVSTAKKPIDWNLSNVRIMYNGAEPISWKLCNQFLEEMSQFQLASSILYPGYGLAEACVAVTLPIVGNPFKSYFVDRDHLKIGDKIVEVTNGNTSNSTSFVEVGRPLAQCGVRISNDLDEVLDDKHIGHIQIKGANVTEGYYNDPEVSADCKTKDHWHRTGDLGFMYDGALIITGRAKNLIIINGQNIYPQDIEEVISEKLNLKPGVVVACSARKDVNHSEELLIFVQQRRVSEEFIPTIWNVKREVLNELNLEVQQVIAVRSIPKTTSGKVQHYQLVQQYLKGEYEEQIQTIAELEKELIRKEDENATSLEDKLWSIAKNILKNDTLEVSQNFFTDGFNSLKATALLSRIHRLGYQISIETLFKNASVAELSEYLKNEKREHVAQIQVAETKENYPLTQGQQRFWMLHQFNQSTASHITSVSKIKGEFHPEAFAKAMKTIVNRHDSLRTVFKTKAGEVYQQIIPAMSFEFEVGVLDFSSQLEPETLAKSRAYDVANSSFDLSEGPLLRVELIKISEAQYYFTFVIHHIISDGWSIDIISKELQSLYKSYSLGSDSALAPLRLQYKDYVAWYASYESTSSYEASRAYWLDRFSGELPTLELPFSHNSGDALSFSGAYLHHTFDNNISKKLKELCASQQVTTFTGIMSVLSSLFYQLTGNTDMIIGTDTAGRIHQDLENQVGYYLNLLPIRIDFSSEDSFTEVLASVHEHLLAGYSHQSYPFDTLISELGLQRNMGKLPLLDVLVLFQNFENALGFNDLIEDVSITSQTIETPTSLNDLLLEFNEKDDSLALTVRYNTAIYNEAQLTVFIASLEELLAKIVAEPTKEIGSYNILSESETDTILNFSKGEIQKYNSESIIDLFRTQVAKTPNARCLTYEGESLTYQEVEARSNQLADQLVKDYGIKNGSFVGLMTNRGFDMIIGMLGVLKSGATYVPIDSEYPVARKNYLIEDSGLEVLIISKEIEATTTVSTLELSVSELSTYNSNYKAINPNKDNVAYLMYTSGTTGKPKGVAVSHGSMLDYVETFKNYFELTENDVVIQQSSFSFDTSVEEIYPILSVGGKLILTPSGGKDVEKLLELTEKHRVSVLSSTPLVIQSLNELIVNNNVPSLRILISGGDALKLEYVSNFSSRIKLYNTYGPTEGTVCTSYYELTKSSVSNCIGSPIANRSIFICNENLALQPTFVIGELYLGGKGIALGYHNQVELTKEKFIENPYGEGTLYKTGDLGYWDNEGNIHFIGRKDHQLKVRGYRVETMEVANAILQVKEINDSHVVGYESHGIQHLVGYFTGNCSEIALREYLRGELPDYMIPTYLVELESFPMTANGKIATDKLPDPISVTEKIYQEARNERDEKLIAIWKAVLKVETIGITDNFFELGGHSLKAVQIASRIQQEFSVAIGLKEIFMYPELQEQSDILAKLEKSSYEAIPVTTVQDGYPLSYAQRRLWFLDQLEIAKQSFNLCWLCNIELGNKAFNPTAFAKAMKTIVNRHDSLRTVFKTKAGEVYQQIIPAATFEFEVGILDFSSQSEPEIVAKSRAYDVANSSFDLSEGPLLRVELIKISEAQYYFIFVIHHIISDGWSIDIISKELQSLYKSYSLGNDSALEPLRLQYKDYVAWYASYESTASYEASRAYWLDRFSGELPSLELPFSHNSGDALSFSGAYLHHTFDTTTCKKLKELCASHQVTTFTGIMSVLSSLFYQLTGNTDMIIGTDTAGRIHQDLENQVGYYLNLLPIRIDFSSEDSFTEVLASVHEHLLAGYSHQSYPFDTLISELGLQRNMGKLPLLDVLVLFQNFENALGFNDLIEDVSITSQTIETPTSLNDLLLEFNEKDDSLALTVRYNTAIYNEAQLTVFIASLEELLTKIVAEPTKEIGSYNILSESETDTILNFSKGEIQKYNSESIIDLFRTQVAKTPNARCLTYEGESLTYQEVEARSNQLADQLVTDYGVKNGSFVGLMTNRGFDMIIGMLGVLKSGATYVPIDSEYPVARKNYLIEDSGLEVLIISKGIEATTTVSTLTINTSELSTYNSNYQGINPNKDDVAYLIYTSGTTGKPKGVAVSHGSMLDYIETFKNYFELTENDVVMQQSSFSFDTSVEEIYPILSVGGELILTPSGGKDVEKLLELTEKHHVSVLSSTPLVIQSLNELIVNKNIPSLRILISGGDALKLEYVSNFSSRIKLYNTYGPTEGTICTSYYELTKSSVSNCIGSPIANRSIFICNDDLALQPTFVIGELYLGGKGIALGYHKQTELTAERFIENPFGEGTLYKTGDLGYWDASGNIHFIGRKDHQLKVRGYRVETMEVANAILQVKEINDSHVVGYESHGIQHLVGYFTGNCSEIALREYLRGELPDYMIPTYLVELESFPMTANGKIATNKLPDPILATEKTHQEARNERDEKLIAIWKTVLKVEIIGITDNFFELGGHSLKAVQIASRIQQEFSVAIGLKEIFMYPELQEQSDILATMEKSLYEAIPVTTVQDGYPLSYAQRRLWFLDQLNEASIAYNITFGHWLQGTLNVDALSYAFTQLIKRHESLRTVFLWKDETVKQYVKASRTVDFSVEYIKYSRSSNDDKTVVDHIFETYNTPFDLSEGPLLKVYAIQLKEDKHFLFINMHHIIADETSVQLLITELQQVYNAKISGNHAILDELRIQYKDFAVWQQASKVHEESVHKTYWLEKLAGEITPLDLPTCFSRTIQQTFDGKRIKHTFGQEISKDFQALVEQNDSSLFMGVLSLVKTLLYRYTGTKDVIVGTPISGRVHPDLENQVGFYLNTLALRDQLSGDMSYETLLAQVKETCLEAYEHQSYPFDLLVEELDTSRNLSRSPLFDVMVVLEDMERNNHESSFSDLTISGEYVDEETSKFDITFYFSKRDDELHLSVEYNTSLFSASRITRMVSHIEELVRLVVSAPKTSIGTYDYLSENERSQILLDFNNTAKDYPLSGSFLTRYEQYATTTPEAIAIYFADRVVSYGELDTSVNQLSNYLKENYNVKQGDCVGLLMDRSEWMLISMLSILKLGGIYLPMDKSYPNSRISYILEDGGADLLISDIAYNNESSDINMMMLPEKIEELSNYNSELTSVAVDENDLAYMIYTSGSTGTPKGVKIKHRSVTNLMYTMEREVSAVASDSLLAVTTYAFDMSVVELFLPLHVGGSVIIASTSSLKSPEKMIELFDKHNPTIMQATPGFWQMLVDAGWKGSETVRVITGGEALSLSLGQSLINYSQTIWNMYGPTETTVYATYKMVKKTQDIQYIGRPVDNAQSYILDEDLQLVPIGVIGTLYMSGAGIAVGYQNKEELTQKLFIKHPYQENTVMYNTGDLCSWNEEGSIKYYGRIDHQIKIRGYRIEFEEIISAMLSCKGIQQSIVIGIEINGEKHLAGYYTSEGIENSALRTHLLDCLPEYMIPTYLIGLETFPLTPNGKIDKRALPNPSEELVSVYVAPTNETERALVAIWEEILGKEQIGIKDNFFELGGHSLKGIQIISRIKKELGITLELKELFISPVLTDVASKISIIQWAKSSKNSDDTIIKKETIIL
ncbi:amino acid adenylation domain-containing protein [Kordia sp. YSTF-M3]|uniref:Amino acid adenylation domain-containing protein n=1 Tax=Kordia aestuariivivens TaxID=2759037 RepID=A0ABR7QET0_9FLAO|nr:non-ribosomal peptide synthetase [Kordia aestuariivivens]MBC8757076.1 amino acid adenylation domain-containing protein [Kordia aestuariivivens]